MAWPGSVQASHTIGRTERSSALLDHILVNFGVLLSLTIYSCLAHVINLATQMLILTYSKTPHYDPKQPDAHVPTSHNKVGLIRVIIVKVLIFSYSNKRSVIDP